MLPRALKVNVSNDWAAIILQSGGFILTNLPFIENFIVRSIDIAKLTTHATKISVCKKSYYKLQNIRISSLSITVFTRLIEPICVYEEPEKSECPHFYDNFIQVILYSKTKTLK